MTNETQTQSTELQEVQVPFEVPEGFRLMTDEEAELMASQIVESRQEKWEIQDIVDSAIAAGKMNAMMRSELYYEFKKGGKMIRGLTSVMIAHLATAQGISEVYDAREFSGDDPEATHYEFTVVVEMPDPRNPDRMIYRSGFAEEPKMLKGDYDKFAKRKAYTKAFRNACLKFLPQDLIMATTFKLANLVPADWTPKPQQKALPPAQNGTQTDAATANAMQACFDAFNEKEQDLLDLGVSKVAFWDALKGVLGVKSREDMTEQQWKDVNTSLKTIGFGEIVRDVLVKCGVNLASLEPEPDRNEV